MIFSGQSYNSLLAYPPDHWALDYMSALAKSQGVGELWVGLDGRSFWAEDNMTMAARQWMASNGEVQTEIKWNNSQPSEDPTKQCVFLSSDEQ